MNRENKDNKSASDIRAMRQARIARLSRNNRANEMQRLAKVNEQETSTDENLNLQEAPNLEEKVFGQKVFGQKVFAERKFDGVNDSKAKQAGAMQSGRKITGRQTVGRIDEPNSVKYATFEITTPIMDHSKPALGWVKEFDVLRKQNWLDNATGSIKLTNELLNDGWRKISQSQSLNTPIQIESPEGKRFWIKNEQSRNAVSAEVEISAFYKYIGWPGSNLALSGNSGNVIIMPALGGPNIIDLGPIGDLFPFETEANGIIAERSFVLSKIDLADLNLINERDVVSFIVYNAIFANTDRHMMNLHIGSLLDTSGNSKGNLLLPIDHGMCLKANGVWDEHLMPEHTPLDIVTGSEIGFYARAPHQMLRPFTQFADMYPDDMELIMEIAIGNVESFINHGALANGIILDHKAISYMRENISWLRHNKAEFISGCQKVVLSEEVHV